MAKNTEFELEPTEAEEQRELFKWAKMQSGRYPELLYMYHVPNGGHRKTREAALLRAEGVRSGVPDIVLPAPRKPFHGLYIELKRQKSGTLSEDQKRYLNFLNFAGYKAVMCRGWKEARETIMSYLKGE